MSEEPTMIERVARSMCEAAEEDWDAASYLDTASGNDPEEQRDYWRVMARAAIEAMKDPPLDILGAMFEAMFEDKWNGSQAPMIGAGWDAGIDAALNEHANAR